MRPQGVALPILGLAAKLTLDDTLTRVAVGHHRHRPGRADSLPRHAGGAGADRRRQFDAAAVEAAVAAAQAQAQLRTSKHRATKEYRQMSRGCAGAELRRVLGKAVARAGESK
jgi:hypothetical protein